MVSTAEKIKFLAITGIGLFSDGYLNSAIGLVVPMLGYIYFEDTNGSISTLSANVIKATFSIGMVVGQLVFGIVADAIGRQKVYGKELMFTILGNLLLILMPWGAISHDAVIAWASVFRVITGIGAGADYPMSSAFGIESNKTKSHTKMVLTIFAFLGTGNLGSSVIYLVLISSFKTAVENDIQKLQWVWRLLFGLPLIPLLIGLYYRLRMTESFAYTKYVAKEEKSTHSIAEYYRDFLEYFSVWKHSRTLIVTSLTWFLFDIAFYGINLNQSIVLSKIGYAKGKTKWDTLHKTAVGNIIMSCAGFVPGYYIGIFLPDLMGAKWQQIIFCTISAILYGIWAGIIDHASSASLMVLFTISQLILNAGPACTTYLIPVEVFPTRVRATAHGISAASGKIGAIFTALVFGIITDKAGLSTMLGILAGVMFLVALLTFLIPNAKGLKLHEIEKGALYNREILDMPSEETGEVSVIAIEIKGSK
ncbi:major facilitator superfamily domain-containing protein [Dipodascopsis uninucleata]